MVVVMKASPGVQIERRGAVRIARLGEDVDFDRSDEVRRAIEIAVDGRGVGIVVDLSGIGSVDGAGVRFLTDLGQYFDERGMTFRVVAPDDPDSRSRLDAAGVGSALSGWDTLADAVRLVQASRLAETFADISRTLLSEETIEGTVQQMLGLAVETIEGCDYAGVCLVHDGDITTPVSTDSVVGQVERHQHEVDEGPCVDAIRMDTTVYSGDLGAEQRWTTFTPRAVELGITSVLSQRLFTSASTLGALNLYSRAPEAFPEQDREAASIFTAHAALALGVAGRHAGSEQRAADMERALLSRDLIGQAKGILMERQHITADEAFAVLSRASSYLNIKLREVAQRLAEPGEPPGGSAASSSGRTW